jgi:tetratricopeptide (TPR) repeat protein
MNSMLRRRQVAALRETLHYELQSHSEWVDLWNLRGLVAAYERDHEKARGSFALAIEKNPRYETARWNLQWLDLLADTPPGSESSREPVPDAMQPPGLLEIVRNLRQDVLPDPHWCPDDPRLAFSALTVAARAGRSESFGNIFESWQRRDLAIDELLRAAGFWVHGAPDMQALAELGVPERLNPGFADLLDRAGRLEAMDGRDAEAQRLFALSALFRGNRAAFLVEKAEIVSRHGHGEQALTHLREAVEANAEWYRAQLALGYELSVRGRHEEAMPHIAAAARLKPGYADVQYQYALLLHAAGENVEAIAALKSALELNPGYHVARIALANLLFDAGREREAAPYLEQVLEEGFQTPQLKGRFGYAMHAAGYRARAEEIFLDAVSQDHDRAEVLCLYGLFLTETDREMEARAVWERALATDPPDDIRGRIETMLAGTSMDETKGDEA